MIGSKIMFENDYEKVTIEIANLGDLNMDQMITSMIVPLLKALSYSDSVIAEYIDC